MRTAVPLRGLPPDGRTAHLDHGGGTDGTAVRPHPGEANPGAAPGADGAQMYDGRKGSPSPLQQAIHLLPLAGRAAELRLTQRLAERGMTRAHLAMLAALAEHGPHAKPDLAARSGLALADALPIVADLLATRLVEVFPVHIDRRHEVVMVNAAGRERLELLHTEAAAAQDDLLRPLTRGERAQLNALLRRVCAAAERPGPGTPRAAAAPQG
ncbi:MarR family winged helix-turn-helix transcriptional regulator [Kitasatospora indigofera]|uniref:MarR family winged helix-turn-helix transcriptional regulator n=1 Tax=Kitasatospora indigofera TaxID=67307 RepID=UPI00167EE20F|nr:MarR family winged helix-turn-helix transcriptional regulator [Kitasatospora indigofera]